MCPSLLPFVVPSGIFDVLLSAPLVCLMLQSIDGFKKFIHNQGIQTLYDYNDEKDLFWNIQHFGQLLRSLVPVRMSIPDGQHRFYIMAQYAQGYWSLTSRAPLQPLPLDDCPFKNSFSD